MGTVRARSLRAVILYSACFLGLAAPAAAQCVQTAASAVCSGTVGNRILFVDSPPGSPFSGTFPNSVTVQNLSAPLTTYPYGILYFSDNANTAATAALGNSGPAMLLTIATGVTINVAGLFPESVLAQSIAQAGGGGALGASDSSVIGGNGGVGGAITLVNGGALSALGTFTAVNRATELGAQSTLDQINLGITDSNLALAALAGTDTSTAAVNAKNLLASAFAVDLSSADGPSNLQNLITGFLLPTLEPLQAYYSGFPLPEESDHVLVGALSALSIGGAGGQGGVHQLLGPSGPTGRGGVGGVGGAISVTNSAALITSGSYEPGILAISQGGQGGAHDGGDLNSQAGNGGGGGAVSVTDSGTISTTGISAPGVFAQSIGGAGAEAYIAGAGGGGGTVTVTESGSIATTGYGAYGVFAQSAGGLGPDSEGSGFGGTGGAAGNASLTFSGSVSTKGQLAYGVFVSSLGGAGGHGGSSSGTGGDGGQSGNASLTISSTATIITTGTGAIAAYAQSAGGTGGIGSDASGFWASAGGGGNGGKGGNVTASNAGKLSTAGAYAYGLFAQAQGGAGGVGGSAAGFISFSGAGGGGAPAGSVTAGNSGVIITTGTGANAFFAQSVGGVGGDAGSAGGFVALGSNGGSEAETQCLVNHLCLDGGAVTATNSGSLSASGQGANGLFAESVGGGGGDGGASSGIFTYGGQGGAGGSGGAISVTNTAGGTVTVSGDDANALYAQSVGGGGGNGGDATSGGTTVSLAIGGKGGAGGNGGAVNVTNAGALAVSAFNTDGIFAQSVGGGGGTGGSATAVSIGALATASVSIGGSGGDGGNGGVLTIANSGSISTQGDFSDAVAVQSVGGGGGSGGSAFSFSGSAGPEFAVSASVSVGGSGGKGGNGGAVSVSNSGAIVTQDWDARGVFAQSVGGGGGDGGSSAAQSITASPGVTVNVDVAVGGSGGLGGTGGEVLVSNSGSIITFGMMSPAVFAQSVGGGGGTGGDASSTSAAFLSDKSATVDVSVGGSGGNGGNGGHVKVTNTGSVTATGDWSNGITAQSVGGGGGTGGAGSQGDFFDGLSPPTDAPDITDEDGNINIKQRALDKLAALKSQYASLKADPKAFGKQVLQNQLDSIKEGLTAKPKSFGVSIGVGGSGGVAGDGGLSEVVNNGDVTTAGLMGFGIFAQSVGGGGGEGGGGNGASSSGDLNIGGGFGGKGGSAGSGGAVNVTNTGTVNTFGTGGIGIFAQSVGGGGGVGGTAGGTSSGARSLSLSIGGQGGSSGNGGAVTVNQNGDVVTFGLGAIGVLAQSVGGGGGYGGGATAANFLNISVGGNGSGGGNGGAVSVTVNGNIATSGDAAYGVFAQSVGGGGGLAGGITASTYVIGVDPFGLLQINTNVPYALANVAVGGGGGAGGNGGAVSVTTAGTITTAGAGAHGIFAQSIAGGGGVGGTGGATFPAALALAGSDGDPGNAGAITINHNGDIFAFGAGADGILAQSINGVASGGGAPSGLGANITISVNGTISGGTASGVGVFIDGGKTNSLTIGANGHVTAMSGLAIVGSQGDDAIDNSGTVTGSVGLGGGKNSFLNRAGATFETGAAVYLGAGNTLTNQGTLSPLGAGEGLSRMVGNLSEAAGSVFKVNADLSGNNATDLLAILGNATLAGKVVPQLDITTAVTGTYTTILDATAITNNGISVDDTLVADYNLKVSATTLQVGVDSINFQPAGANLDAAEGVIGNYLQAVWQAHGASPQFNGLLNYLAGLTSPAGYAQVMDALNPTPGQTQLSAAMLSGMSFTNNLMSCPGAATMEESLVEHACSWIRINGNWAGQGATGRGPGYALNGSRFQAGWQTEIEQDVFLGLSAALGQSRIQAGPLTLIDGQNFNWGAVVKYQTLPWTFAAALSYSHDWSVMLRQIPLPTGALGANSKPEQDGLDARLRATYLYRDNDSGFYAKPSADLDFYDMIDNGYREQGAGAFDVIAKSSGGMVVGASAGAELGLLDALSDTSFIRPYLSTGFTLLSRSRWTMNGRFEGAGAASSDFLLPVYFPDDYLRLAPGLEFNMGPGSFRLEYETRSSAHYHDSTASAKLEARF